MQLTLDLVSAQATAEEEAVESLENRVCAAVNACFRRAEIHFQRRFERAQLAFNLRGMAAAVAYPARNAIRINRRLLDQNAEDFLLNTIPHEVSHLIAYRVHGQGIAPHGAEWAAIMREVYGLKPLRCHNYDVCSGLTAAYWYRCGCDAGHTFTTRRHNNARRGRLYLCRRCRQPLRFSHREAPVD
ncbi:SprT-like domain-containing protein [Sulfuricaulis sp.]|uniref:SprT-like domain-containing protein n=1 Tax=Sulfuricaulis sp. TaxID=2003553 RepID=UPI00355A8C12